MNKTPKKKKLTENNIYMILKKNKLPKEYIIYIRSK